MKKLLYLFAIMALPFIACDDSNTEDNVNPELVIADSEVILSSDQKEYTMQIYSNTDWVVVSKTANISSITPASGSGNGEVKYTIDAYQGTTSREEMITMRTKGTKFVVTALMKIKQTPNPELAFSAPIIDATYSGAEYKVRILSNINWHITHTSANVGVNPLSGTGSTDLTFTVATNAGEPREESITVSALNNPEIKATLIIKQGQKPSEATLSLDKTSANIDFGINSFNVDVEANSAWKVVTSPSVTVEPSEGSGNITVKVTVTSFNESDKPIDHTATFSSDEAPKPKAILTITQAIPGLTYGGVNYNVVKVAPGQWWMGENLRYIPEGKTVASDPSIDSGIWYPCNIDKAAITDPAEIAKLGYLYDTPTAVGLTEITEENSDKFEGAQGICPQGWHIPTAADCNAIVATSSIFYDEIQKGAAIEKLEAAGFITQVVGSRNRGNSTAVGSYAYIASKPGTSIITSTKKAFSIKTETGAITSQNQVLMYTNTTAFQRVTLLQNSNYSGMAVRCVKNSPTN